MEYVSRAKPLYHRMTVTYDHDDHGAYALSGSHTRAKDGLRSSTGALTAPCAQFPLVPLNPIGQVLLRTENGEPSRVQSSTQRRLRNWLTKLAEWMAVRRQAR